MTLPSLKKRPTTAPTSRRANLPKRIGRAALLAVISTAAISAVVSVPQSLAAQESAAAAEQRPGWNLQWRTSPQVATQQARQISDAAFAQPRRATPQPVASAGGVANLQPIGRPTAAPGNVVSAVATTPSTNQLRSGSPLPIRRVAWVNQNTPSTGTPPTGGMTVPDNLFRDNAANPPQRPQSGSAFTLPGEAPSNFQELPSPTPVTPGSLTPPKIVAPPVTPEPIVPSDLSEMFEIDPLRTVPQTAPQPEDDSSIRGMIENEPAPEDARPRSETIPQDGDDVIDDLNAPDSPSDRDTFAPNPFGQRNDQRSERDANGERRPSRGMGDRPSIFQDDEGPASSGTGLSCEDFRNRIEESTIDQVSLDISPPFRPDVIDEDEFQNLKSKFNDKQASRVWRSHDGRPMGTGRLRDLAYEKAVIETEFGTEEDLPLNRLSEADLAYISQNWGLPTECVIEQVAFTPRRWTPVTMTYTASNLCHKPLYFEEVNLERYGHTAGPFLQPVISSAHFFVNIAVLPYKMGVHSPHECQYALGYYRPGNCAPWIIPPVPLSVRGAWYQAAAISGAALLIP